MCIVDKVCTVDKVYVCVCMWYTINAVHVQCTVNSTSGMYTVSVNNMWYTYSDDDTWDDDVHSILMHSYTLWCTHYDDDAVLHSMILDMMNIHAMVWWCSSMHYDVYLMTMMHAQCTLRWWWRGCIPYDDDAYPTMIYACLMFSESRVRLLV